MGHVEGERHAGQRKRAKPSTRQHTADSTSRVSPGPRPPRWSPLTPAANSSRTSASTGCAPHSAAEMAPAATKRRAVAESSGASSSRSLAMPPESDPAALALSVATQAPSPVKRSRHTARAASSAPSGVSKNSFCCSCTAWRSPKSAAAAACAAALPRRSFTSTSVPRVRAILPAMWFSSCAVVCRCRSSWFGSAQLVARLKRSSASAPRLTHKRPSFAHFPM